MFPGEALRTYARRRILGVRLALFRQLLRLLRWVRSGRSVPLRRLLRLRLSDQLRRLCLWLQWHLPPRSLQLVRLVLLVLSNQLVLLVLLGLWVLWVLLVPG